MHSANGNLHNINCWRGLIREQGGNHGNPNKICTKIYNSGQTCNFFPLLWGGGDRSNNIYTTKSNKRFFVLANMSTTESVSISISRWILSRANAVRRSSPMRDLIHVFKRLRVEKLCSALELKHRLLHVWTKPQLTMQLTSGVGVFAHVCGQEVDTLSDCCDDITILIYAYDKNSFIFL